MTQLPRSNVKTSNKKRVLPPNVICLKAARARMASRPKRSRYTHVDTEAGLEIKNGYVLIPLSNGIKAAIRISDGWDLADELLKRSEDD